LTVDGARLFLMTRGADRRAPVLLWLHGGPGGAERPLFRYFNGDLEDRFVVVYWDQRGAGRSFDPKADPHRLSVARHLADLDAVVRHLRSSLGREKIVLIGHSWGAALGLLYVHAHPDAVSAFIGVNPLVSMRAAQQAQYDFVLAEASRRKDDDALERLRKIGPPPHASAARSMEMEALADRYGGVVHRDPHKMWVVLRGIFAGVVTPWEIPRLLRANDVSLEAMNGELLGLDLARSVPGVDVPVFFFLGRYDRHIEAAVAAAYLEALRAPVKRLSWFENSAHNVPFEEPGRFDAEVESALRSLGIAGNQGGQAPHVDRNRAVLRYRSPRSGHSATTVPDERRLAISMAPATAAPLDIPTKSPSSIARRRAVSNAGSSSTINTSSRFSFR
jgi:pimeloyl-ACP methyl ester carboxylesterase